MYVKRGGGGRVRRLRKSGTPKLIYRYCIAMVLAYEFLRHLNNAARGVLGRVLILASVAARPVNPTAGCSTVHVIARHYACTVIYRLVPRLLASMSEMKAFKFPALHKVGKESAQVRRVIVRGNVGDEDMGGGGGDGFPRHCVHFWYLLLPNNMA